MKSLIFLLVLVAFGISGKCSEVVRCYSEFNTTTGKPGREIGDVDKDDCCQNPHYGYQEADGELQFCGLSVWSDWSEWSPCNILCGEGVRQKTRKCFGINKKGCQRIDDNLLMEPCNGTCCDVGGWSTWLPWSQCSVTCNGVGSRSRSRYCTSPPECQASCSGDSNETERCEHLNKCPVHGGWSGWSDWSSCSGSCIDSQNVTAIVPTRLRERSCSNPAPTTDTNPHGQTCPGDHVQVQSCSEIPNCPVNGNWGAWSTPGPCSVTCGEGLQMSNRKCDSPSPKHGGEYCKGESSKTSACQSPCPVHGFWTGWSVWSECSTSCIPQGRQSIRSRQRSCTNPIPSSNPPGQTCQGESKNVENCVSIPYCSVNGAWGPWSAYSTCPVTCGVGLQASFRRCDNPAPIHGGHLCPGEGRRTKLCSTTLHCPVHGVWSEWSEWGPCKHPFNKDRVIRCKKTGGSQNRERTCLRAYDGSFCSGSKLTEKRVCYDVTNCHDLSGTWDGWEPWGNCRPLCGKSESRRFRFRNCKPDYSNYNPTIGHTKENATFFGKPKPYCGPTPDGKDKSQMQLCKNIPSCS